MNGRRREISEMEQGIREFHGDKMQLCKGLRYLLDHDYVKHQAYFVGHGEEMRVVHTVLLPGPGRGKKGKASDFLLNHCPICGSKFTPSDGDCPPLPNCQPAPQQQQEVR